MKKLTIGICLLLVGISSVNAENNLLEKFNILIGNWSGEGEGFGNSKSKTKSSFQYVMNKKYIEVINESVFDPTDKNPEGEHHIDKGYISFDKERSVFVMRQFNIEGFVNQYILNESLSTNEMFVFETEKIENFVPGGKARWTIQIINDSEYEAKFYLTYPGKEEACFGTNRLKKNQ